MAETVQFQQQFKVTGPDGRVLYIGAGKVLNPFEFKYKGTAAGTLMDVCEAVVMDTTNSIVPTMLSYAAGATISTSLPQTEEIVGKRIAGATDTGFIGVCLTRLASADYSQPIYLPAPSVVPGASPGIGVAAGVGSIVPVKSLASSSVTSNNLTHHVIGSSTAGSANGVATTTLGYGLGYIVKTAGGAGSTTTMNIADGYLGVLVMPH